MQKKVSPIFQRKDEHIGINLEQDVEFSFGTGFDEIHFEHNALPDLDLDDIDTRSNFLGHEISFPLLISSMTGGTERAQVINQRLAIAANEHHIPIALGSQRAQLVDPSSRDTFLIRDLAPNVPIIANIGAVQLNYGVSVDDCQRIVDLNRADGLYLHLNPLQEALQAGGDTNWKGLLPKIAKICRKLSVPVLVKEVGFGLSAQTIRKLIEAGVQVIDVAGAGGTSWAKVEQHRQKSDSNKRLAATFAEWGIPTVNALQSARNADPMITLIASGGLRNGLHLAKAIALGADLGGIARPFLFAAEESVEKINDQIHLLKRELQVTMFATGSADLRALKSQQLYTR